MTQQEIQSIAITDENNNILYNGAVVFYMLQEYAARYMICDSVTNFLFKFASYNGYKIADFRRAYAAMYATYNPLNNYDMVEKSVDLKNDGETTRTRKTAAGHNTVTTSSTYDYSTETAADSNDKPTVKNYTTTYDDASLGRLSNYTENTGKTTQRTYTAAGDNSNVNTVTDDMQIDNTESHEHTSMTFDNTTYTADYITAHELSRSGNIGVTTSQQMIQSTIDLYKQSLLYDYIYDFISRYTFYAAGGECYDY